MPLIKGTDPGAEVQAKANADYPLGWCNSCVGKAKQAVADGHPPPGINGAVTLVPRLQMMGMPGGMGQQVPAVATIPSCYECITVQSNSGLVPGTAGFPNGSLG
jgi:hypothetical protein